MAKCETCGHIDPAESKDLDETRRLLYMALLAGKTKRYNLAGTVVNAIRHHQKADPDEDPEVLESQVIACVEGVAEDDTWVRGQIRRCIAALGD